MASTQGPCLRTKPRTSHRQLKAKPPRVTARRRTPNADVAVIERQTIVAELEEHARRRLAGVSAQRPDPQRAVTGEFWTRTT
jgi:hypothetical protein